MWLGELVGLTGDTAEVHYWGTRNASWAKAVFKPAYVGSTSGKTYLTFNTASIMYQGTFYGLDRAARHVSGPGEGGVQSLQG